MTRDRAGSVNDYQLKILSHFWRTNVDVLLLVILHGRSERGIRKPGMARVHPRCVLDPSPVGRKKPSVARTTISLVFFASRRLYIINCMKVYYVFPSSSLTSLLRGLLHTLGLLFRKLKKHFFFSFFLLTNGCVISNDSRSQEIGFVVWSQRKINRILNTTLYDLSDPPSSPPLKLIK